MGAGRACFQAFEGPGISDVLGTHPTSWQTSKGPYRSQHFL